MEYCLSPHDFVMDLNNVMVMFEKVKLFDDTTFLPFLKHAPFN